jgi:hypothetical protein
VTPHATVYVRGENVFKASNDEVISYRASGAVVLAGLKLRAGY